MPSGCLQRLVSGDADAFRDPGMPNDTHQLAEVATTTMPSPIRICCEQGQTHSHHDVMNESGNSEEKIGISNLWLRKPE
jgi:hypothetical protein